MRRLSAFLSDTIVEEEVSVGGATWGNGEAADGRQAEGFLGRPGAPRLVSGADSEVAEEAGNSLTSSTG